MKRGDGGYLGEEKLFLLNINRRRINAALILFSCTTFPTTFVRDGAEEALTIVLLNDFGRPSIIPWADNAAIARGRYKCTCIVHLSAPNTFWKRDIDLISKDRAIFITTEAPFVFIKRGSVCYAKTETMDVLPFLEANSSR